MDSNSDLDSDSDISWVSFSPVSSDGESDICSETGSESEDVDDEEESRPEGNQSLLQHDGHSSNISNLPCQSTSQGIHVAYSRIIST